MTTVGMGGQNKKKHYFTEREGDIEIYNYMEENCH
jgi:hypothetical protein